jgi:hypothetical protein
VGLRAGLASNGIRSPDRPARSESLYRLSSPGPRLKRKWGIILKYILKTQFMGLWSTFIWRSVVPSSPVCRQ